MRVEQIMTQPAMTCGMHNTLHHAAQLMWEHDCGAIPVVGGDGRIVGIVTDRDACMAAYTQARPLHQIPVHQAMAKEVFTCRPDQSVEDVEQMMADKQIRRLPVVDAAGQVVGLLSLGDIARELSGSRKKNAIRDVVQTLATICAPRHQSIEVAKPSAAATSPQATV